MTDAILPPFAARPDEVCQLVCAALSDGDLDAALAHYEPDAVTAPSAGRVVSGRDAIRHLLASAAAARLLYTVIVDRVLAADEHALVHGRWSSTGTDRTGAEQHRAGQYWAVVRRSDGTWRIAIEVIVPAGPDPPA